MKKVFRVVSTAFWDDGKVTDDFSPEDRYFMLYLLTNPHTTQLGIYSVSVGKMAFELGYSKEAVRVLLDRFEVKYNIIKWSRETDEIAIRNYLVYSITTGGKPVMDCLLRETKEVRNRDLLRYIYNNLNGKREHLNNTVCDYLDYLKNNENDNERLVNDSLYDSSYDSSDIPLEVPVEKPKNRKKFVPPTAEEVMEYCIERGLEYVNPDAFVSFYASKGWYVGKNKMTNWHMAVSGWNARQRDNNGTKHTMPEPVVENQPKYDFAGRLIGGRQG